MKLSYLIYALLLVAGFSSCKKDDDDANDESRYVIITKAPWKLEAYGTDADNNLTLNVLETATQPCDLDDTYTFNTNGNMVINVGATTCFPGQLNSSESWSLSTDGNTINYLSLNYTIKSISQNRLEIYYRGTSTNQITVFKR